MYTIIYHSTYTKLPLMHSVGLHWLRRAIVWTATVGWDEYAQKKDRQQPWPFVKYNAANNTARSCWSSSKLYRKRSLFYRLPTGCQNTEETLWRELGKERGKCFPCNERKAIITYAGGFWSKTRYNVSATQPCNFDIQNCKTSEARITDIKAEETLLSVCVY